MSSKKVGFLVIGIIGFLLFLTIFRGYQNIIGKHELTHEAINKQFNLKSKTTINLFSGSVEYTYSEDFPEEDLRIVRSLHAVNELVTYQFSNFYILISLMMAGILIILVAIVIR